MLNETEFRVHRLNELLADGRCTEEEVDAVVATNPRPFFDTYVENSSDPGDYAREAVCDCGDDVEDVAHLAFLATRLFTGIPDRHIDFSDDVSQRPLLHCIFGPLPFRSITVNSQSRTAAVRQLADAIYEDRDFDSLPVLADALKDAGCSDAELLGHLRSPGPHVRGCWAVDLVLGKS
jgi:hypothetical protein